MELQYMKALEGQVGGFNYDNSLRNRALIESKAENKTSLQYTKTGTTICGVVFKVSLIPSTKLGYRMAFVSLLILDLQAELPSVTKTASRFITWLQIFTRAELEPPLTAIM